MAGDLRKVLEIVGNPLWAAQGFVITRGGKYESARFTPRLGFALKHLPIGWIGAAERCITRKENYLRELLSDLVRQPLTDAWIGDPGDRGIGEAGVSVRDQVQGLTGRELRKYQRWTKIV